MAADHMTLTVTPNNRRNKPSPHGIASRWHEGDGLDAIEALYFFESGLPRHETRLLSSSGWGWRGVPKRLGPARSGRFSLEHSLCAPRLLPGQENSIIAFPVL